MKKPGHNCRLALELGALKTETGLVSINVEQLGSGAAIGRKCWVVEADKGLAHFLKLRHLYQSRLFQVYYSTEVWNKFYSFADKLSNGKKANCQ